MKLQHPFCISARLLPALKIGDGWLSFDPKTHIFYLDTPEFEYEIKDYRPGCSHGIQDSFRDILIFFESAITSANFYEETDVLFPKHVTKWLVANEHDICGLDCELDEENLVT